MGYKLEVIRLSVGEVDKSLTFYAERVGFKLDVDYAPTAHFRVVQLTPPGSSCSVQFGVALTDPSAGATRATYLVVDNIVEARRELIERGVDVGDIRHKTPVGTWQGRWEPGVDRGHRDYASFADFSDPDGNGWVLQERGYRSVEAASKADSNHSTDVIQRRM